MLASGNFGSEEFKTLILKASKRVFGDMQNLYWLFCGLNSNPLKFQLKYALFRSVVYNLFLFLIPVSYCFIFMRAWSALLSAEQALS